MISNDFYFTVNKSNESDLLTHFWNVDNYFLPPLSSYVNLSDYSNKLFQKAERIECWYQGQLIGLIAFYNNFEKSLSFITNVSVLKCYSGNGISNKLMLDTFEFLRNKEISKIELYVDKQNIRAINFYSKFNFICDEENNGKFLMVLNL
jgi:ribosomal protein S18 acetylase RimI-like enzyme